MFLEVLKALAAEVAQRAVKFYREYPARSISYIVTAVVAVGGLVGYGVDAESLTAVLTFALPILLGGEAIHRKVTPVANLVERATVPIQFKLDGARLAEAVERVTGPVAHPGAPGEEAAEEVDTGETPKKGPEAEATDEAPKAPRECRHGHKIDGSNGDACEHGHPA